MSSPTPTFRPNGGLKGPTRLLYLSGKSPDKEAPTIKQLAALGSQVQITTVTNAADVLARISEGGRYHTLIISHTLPTTETVGIITSLRRASAPIAIVPIVTESQRDLYASAAAVGADDTLILLGGTLLHPIDTLIRAKQSRHVPAYVETAAPPVPATPVVRPPADGPISLMEVAPEPTRPTVVPLLGRDPAAMGSSRPPAAPDAERTAWESERRELLARITGLEEQAARSPELEAALSQATDELRETQAAQTADRAAWETTREDLERTLADLDSVTQARDELQQALAATQADSATLADSHAAALQRVRDEYAADVERLRSRRDEAHADDIARLRAEHEAAHLAQLSRLRAEHDADMGRLRAEQDADRLRGDAGHEAQASRAHQAELEATAKLHAMTEAHAVDERAWEAARLDLERRVAELDALARTRDGIEDALQSALAELARATEAYDRERAAWDEAREQLESELRTAAESQSNALATVAVQAELDQRLLDAASSELALGRALEQAREETGRLSATVQALESELEQARAVQAPLSADSPAVQAELDRLAARQQALEASLRQARRFEAAGRLAAEVVPDLDVVAAVVDECAAALTRSDAPAEAPPVFAERLSACAADAVPSLRQLLTFSRKQAREEQRVDLTGLVERASPVLSRLLGSHIEFRVRPGAAPSVWVDEEDLDQILTTMVVTARDLLAAGGSLTVETGTAATDDGAAPSPTLAVIASGRGVLPAVGLPAIVEAVDRCGASLHLGGAPGRTAEYRVLFTHRAS